MWKIILFAQEPPDTQYGPLYAIAIILVYALIDKVVVPLIKNASPQSKTNGHHPNCSVHEKQIEQCESAIREIERGITGLEKDVVSIANDVKWIRESIQ